MLPKYLLHNLAQFCLCNLLHREKICDRYSDCHKISIKAIVIKTFYLSKNKNEYKQLLVRVRVVIAR